MGILTLPRESAKGCGAELTIHFSRFSVVAVGLNIFGSLSSAHDCCISPPLQVWSTDFIRQHFNDSKFSMLIRWRWVDASAWFWIECESFHELLSRTSRGLWHTEEVETTRILLPSVTPVRDLDFSVASLFVCPRLSVRFSPPARFVQCWWRQLVSKNTWSF